MKATFLFTSTLISIRLSTESEIPADKVNILGLRAGALDNRPGTWFGPNHFVPIISEWKANDKGTEKHDKTSKNRKLRARIHNVPSFRPPLIKHHPVNQFKKGTVDMAALEDCSKAQENRKHQHQMWPRKENSIPSEKTNSRGWCL